MNGHNPDILSCLANLSADEVFTPPKLAAAMLDILPPDLFRRPDTTFLDPVCKSGVFLREIARRLNDGLKDQLPDPQARINHILTNQVFGLAITELTALLSRRTVYCSKKADGKFSIATAFTKPDGNIRLPKVEHAWSASGKCQLCGASQNEYERDESLETYAYPFIHDVDPTEVFKVKFDVIVGNPPYQLADGGFGRAASPIYQHFIGQAKKLEPRFLMMIVPARWFSGGKGLEDFRAEMLADDRIRTIVDYEDASEVFPGVDIAGGICYFLWERDSKGACEIVNVAGDVRVSSTRALNEFSTLIRHGDAVSIVRKVLAKDEPRMIDQVSSRKPFGLDTKARPMKSGEVQLRWQGGVGPFKLSGVTAGHELIDQWKVITSKASHDHGGMPDRNGLRKVLAVTEILAPGSICSETYIVVGSYNSRRKADNLLTYLKTRFVRFLIAQVAHSQDVTKSRFSLVPMVDVSQPWTDEDLAARYGLTDAEVAFIASKIRAWE